MARRARPTSEHPLDDEFATIAEFFRKLDPGYDDYFLAVMKLAFFSGAYAAFEVVRKGSDPRTVIVELNRHRDEVLAWADKRRH